MVEPGGIATPVFRINQPGLYALSNSFVRNARKVCLRYGVRPFRLRLAFKDSRFRVFTGVFRVCGFAGTRRYPSQLSYREFFGGQIRIGVGHDTRCFVEDAFFVKCSIYTYLRIDNPANGESGACNQGRQDPKSNLMRPRKSIKEQTNKELG